MIWTTSFIPSHGSGRIGPCKSDEYVFIVRYSAVLTGPFLSRIHPRSSRKKQESHRVYFGWLPTRWHFSHKEISPRGKTSEHLLLIKNENWRSTADLRWKLKIYCSCVGNSGDAWFKNCRDKIRYLQLTTSINRSLCIKTSKLITLFKFLCYATEAVRPFSSYPVPVPNRLWKV